MRPPSLPTRIRLSNLRSRIVHLALMDFAASMDLLDRLEGWAQRLRSADLVDVIVLTRHEVITYHAQEIEVRR